ncbi:MAG: hypothetical protein JW822_11655 [Spirochaetales bacterium]|nr:hypothetical protein [Spirochaetales bacterium]
MFGIGLGELLLILFLLFLISPKDIPKLLKKAGRLLRQINTIKDEITHVAEDKKPGKNEKKMKKDSRPSYKQKRTDL